jgi:hypothetical protein
MLKQSVIIAALLICFGAAPASAKPQRAPVEPVEQVEIEQQPMLFYLAKGEPNACGEGCNEWIAAEGQFDSSSAERLRGLLRRLGSRKLPIYFYSPGGFTDNGVAIGRMLREHDMTAGVARTIPEGCIGKTMRVCDALKRSGATLMARWRSINAGCNSSCVYALIGARVRQVPPGARVGIHSSKMPYVGELARAIADVRLATFNDELRSYIHEMGINDDLYGAIMKVPFEKVHILSRDELAHFRIDTHDFQETRWTLVEASPTQRAEVIKLITRADGSKPGTFHTALVRLSCGEPSQIIVRYVREVTPDKQIPLANGTWAAISLVAGPTGLSFPRQSPISRVELVDTGPTTDGREASAPFQFFETAGGQRAIELIETNSLAELASSPRVLKLSTEGLPQALVALRRSCG